MVHLRFELTNRRFFHELGPDLSRRKMIFDAFVESSEELRVIEKGFLRKGDVSITTTPREGQIGSIYYVGAWRDSDTDSDYPHSFSIETSLPFESFEPVLNVDLDAYQIFLRFSTSLFGTGLTYDVAPDGSEKCWDTEKSNPVKAEEVVFVIVPRDKPAPGLSEDDHGEASRPVEDSRTVEPPPIVLSDPQIIRHLRSIWWAIVMIGGLVLLKLYR
ncbi:MULTISPECIES: hypothetical protein [unclassified Pseudomonas]|uniref:hypothetical protein n=1 Tax=unclassified Pseudomonas TaxID=196821 RepID=UPI0039B72A12